MTKKAPSQCILSASRRTDIPAFYMDWFMSGIEAGGFAVKNPFNNKSRHVPAAPEAVHTIVFWSKDFRAFLDGGHGERLCRMGYRLFFHFTLNSDSAWLEPGIPPLAERLETLRRLCRRFGPECISWRFDPVCFFTLPDGRPASNLGDFPQIARTAADLGITRCITSFLDLYPKVAKRTAGLPGFSFRDPPLEKKTRVLQWMEAHLQPLGIQLYTCCEPDVLENLPGESSVRPSGCISGRLLMELFGGRPSLRKDAGQRVRQGCGCTESRDVGSYREQPCLHNCLFCYANPRPTGAGGAVRS